jgi:type III pantothenate kinase
MQRLLAVDIGNTQIAIGGFIGTTLAFEFQLKTDAGRSSDEYAALLLPLIQQMGHAPGAFENGIICSVVPNITAVFEELCGRYFKIRPLVIGPGVKTGLAIKAIDSASVGSDRIANAVAVRNLFGAPALVVDFGTATSIDVIGKEGSYLGGVIAPGVSTSLEGLVGRAARLPFVELSWPKQIVGKTTTSAMQSGLMEGHASMVDGLIEKIEKEVGCCNYVVGTGSLASLFEGHCQRISHFRPDLTLQGMRLIADQNMGAARD